MSEEDKLKELGIVSPELSVAKAIDRLSTSDRIKMMSSLKSRLEVRQLSMMYSFAEELGWGWLSAVADNMLQLYVSCDKGRGRKDIVTVVKQPAIPSGGGITDKIKSFVKQEG